MRLRLKEEPEEMDMKIDESAELLGNNNEDPNEKVKPEIKNGFKRI